MQLGHFAGFVRRSWRANDFLWGRLDGAARLVDLLLAPTRLRLSPVRRDALAAALGVPDVAAFLATVPAKAPAGAYVDPRDEDELHFWRTAFRDALAVAILGAELDAIATAFDADVARGFEPASDLVAALRKADASPRERFADYAEKLCGRDGGLAIQARVAQQRGSNAGLELVVDTIDVAADLLATEKGPLGVIGKLLDMPTGAARMAVRARTTTHHVWRALSQHLPWARDDDEAGRGGGAS